MEQLDSTHALDAAAHPPDRSSSFRPAHCSREGQVTPPPSPQPPTGDGSRTQLSRLLHRCRSAKSKQSRLLQARFPTATSQETSFPLLLPEFPPICENNSPTTTLPSPGLRRMSASYNDLRALARNEAASSPISSLLPSPITGALQKEGGSCFRFHNPRERLPTPIPNEDSLDSLHILSYYCDDQDCDDQDQGSHSSEHGILENDNLSTASESMPVTPRDNEDRGILCSDESGWLANTTSHEERMRRFKARYYQVIQGPCALDRTEGSEDGVKIATVLVGPGKPRLVHIQRPPSSQSRTESPGEGMCAPSTPKQGAIEVSAFSPYDTPCDMPQIESHVSDSICPRISEASPPLTGFVPQLTTFAKRSKTSISDTREPHGADNCIRKLTDPFMTSPRRTRSDRSFRTVEKRWAVLDTLEVDLHSISELSPSAKSAKWSRCRKLERALSAVTVAIDEFPDGMLCLDSPAVVELRNPQISNATYIEALCRIFPSASPPLISAITAWVIVDLHFSRLKDQIVPIERYWAQAAASNESLHRIPEKAREMLGIGLPDETSIRLNEYALRKRAMAMQAGIGVIGQRLIEGLRGSWDEDIWRSLKVLVEVIEASSPRWP
ncbi:uncharacterized protein PV07_10827 [Cladophialophora immunda]|uniref:Uncharacterized protein n=1 Tax=Cladophialophora immunda TaxID=569365 RepID=A0A0D1ZBQ6_9EURO|nr:uncharacterized protein PV07_10827 [Cladophialophora immunda]KIW25166.1 hypothetical protein PV07_10827 [Cladophialophora immunda]